MCNRKLTIIALTAFVLLAGFCFYLILKSPNPQPIITPTPTASQEFMTLKVYYNNPESGEEFSCNKVLPVTRQIPKTQGVARAALEELFKGPTDEEKKQGYSTSIPSGVKIQSLNIENATAKIDFDEQLDFQVGGSCRVAAIRSQITETLKQFPTIKTVIISINGRTGDILQP